MNVGMNPSKPVIGEFVATPNDFELEEARPRLIDRTQRLNEALDELDGRLAKLREVLEPVLRPAVPEENATPGRADSDSDSWLTEYLDAATFRAYQTVNALASMTRRVDL